MRNLMAHAQKPHFVFRLKGRVHLNLRRSQFSRLLVAEVCASVLVMLDTPRSEVACESTGYPLHSPVSPSLPLPCVTVCHHIPNAVYHIYLWLLNGRTTRLPSLFINSQGKEKQTALKHRLSTHQHGVVS